MDNATGEGTERISLPQNYQPTAEEKKLLNECRVESNVRGSIGALLAGGIAYRCVKSFNMTLSPKYGPWPKVGSACLFGFFVGKLMAIPACYKKFQHLPNSPLGNYMRQRTMGRGESLPTGSGPDANLNFTVVNPSYDTDKGQMNSALDIDVYNSPSNMDSYTGNELNGLGPKSGTFADDPPERNYVDKSTVSYAELRRRNREEYTRADKERPGSGADDIPAAQPTGRSIPSMPMEKKNKYGDTWE